MFGGNQGNMAGMMKKVQKLQADMAKLQEELKKRTLEVTTGGGAEGTVTGQPDTEPGAHRGEDCPAL